MKQKSRTPSSLNAEKERFWWNDWNCLYGVHNLHYENGFLWPAQYHDELEIVSIPPGLSGHVLINGVLHPVENGCFFVIAPGMIHSFDIRFRGRKSFIGMLMKTDKLIAMLDGFQGCSSDTIRDALHRLPVSLPSEAYELHRLLCGLSKVHMLETGKMSDEFSLIDAATDVGIVFSVLSRILRHSGAKEHPVAPTAVHKALDILEKRSADPVSLAEIAGLCYVSKFHLSKIFRKHTGMTLWDYLQMLRIRKAKELLWNEDRTVTEVCFACGFSDPSYFIRIFKRYAGRTPKQWRKNAGG